MKKIFALIALFALFAFAASPALAGMGVTQDGTRKGQFHKINLTDGITINDAGDVALDTVSVDAVGGTIVQSTYYTRFAYYSRLTMIGSGAPAGSVIMRGGPAVPNCGAGGDGTTVYLCGSDGTNWRAL